MSDRKKDQVPVQSPIAIVGMSCLFPGSRGLDEYWANVRDGVDAITEVPASHWNVGDYFDADPKAPDMTYGHRGGFLEAIDFDPMGFGISPRDLEATDSTQLLGMYVAREALRDAGYGADGRDFERERTSVILGVSGTLPLVIPLGARLGHPIWRQALVEAGVDPETSEDVIARIADGYVPWQENSFPGLLANVVAGPDRQQARLAWNQLHRRRGVRLVIECHSSRLSRARNGSVRYGPQRGPGHVQ